MYKYKNKHYATPGYYLNDNNVVADWFYEPSEKCVERKLDLSKVTVNECIQVDRLILCATPKDKSYENIKKAIIKARYSNDDQIAIILNNEEDEVKNMQAYREFAKNIAKLIIEKLSQFIGCEKLDATNLDTTDDLREVDESKEDEQKNRIEMNKL